MNKIIGYSAHTRYWQQYVFQHPPEGYRYTRAIELPKQLVRKTWQKNTRLFFPVKPIDLYHVYNCIVVNRKPWVVEVEDVIPRYGNIPKDSKVFQYGIQRLRSADCKKIIFVSEHARNNALEELASWGVPPEKSTVVYRAVECYEPLEKPKDYIQILFVGNGFFRKGGYEVLKAFQVIENPDIRLVIISRLEVDWRIYPTDEEIAEAKKIIANDSRISLLSDLSHHEVIDWMRRSHIYISPTYADPFNNTVLEAMGCGLPVISSTASALPEMVKHGENGWLLDMNTLSSKEVIKEINIYLIELIQDSGNTSIKAMGMNSLQIAKEKFSIQNRNEQLSRIYKYGLP